MASTLLPAKNPGEVINVTFAYSTELGSTETIIGTPVVSCSLISGVDPNPSAMLNGIPTVQISNVVQEIVGGLDGCTYQLSCLAALSSTRVLARIGILPVTSN
jgi:hypothetical protein